MSTLLKWNLSLSVALIVCVFLIFNSGRDVSQPNVEYMPDMAYSHAHETFSTSPVFRDGVTLQRPPAGAIARGRMPLRYQATAEEALRAGRELTSPLDLSEDAVMRRGAESFGVFCQPCHGATGRGDGPISTRGYPPPPSLSAEKSLTLADGQVFHIITFGQGNMPGHASQISPEDRWSIVAHVRELQDRATSSQAASDDESPTPEDGES